MAWIMRDLRQGLPQQFMISCPPTPSQVAAWAQTTGGCLVTGGKYQRYAPTLLLLPLGGNVPPQPIWQEREPATAWRRDLSIGAAAWGSVGLLADKPQGRASIKIPLLTRGGGAEASNQAGPGLVAKAR